MSAIEHDYNRTGPPQSGREFVLGPAHEGARLDHALQALLPEYSRARLQQWIRGGAVRVDGMACTPKQRMWQGARVAVAIPERALSRADAPEDIPLAIVHEDDALLVIDKPHDFVVHPGNGNPTGTLLNALLAHAPELAALPRAGIVHRLDKDTSGLMVVAKTLEAQTDLVRQLAARDVRREYVAVVSGAPPESGEIDAPVGRHPTQRTRMAVVQHGRPALTRYRVVERLPRHTVVECRLSTGRTHQIRVHMESIGHPIVGDPVYRHRTRPTRASDQALIDAFGRQALHAFRLGLVHPETREPMLWEASPPADLQALIDALRAAGD